ncbi:Lipopolysaccharide core heptose(II) kinase [Trema orientale]|uniref:Lipopolysaccharide core heptose(II) kinase n=1 Tax=Trema orientale TaxID=63057 RepID=A0A2P5G1I7_TREOI|nr:Lipopolysaccharide core heptose(II) kinase [Trema orientale]
MGWGSICRRRMKVFTVAFIVYFDYKALQQREKWTSESKRAALWEKAHERNAKRVLKLIVELEGLWVKLGQYLSTRADVLPGAYISLLKQLQDSLPPRPMKEVCRTLEKELGKQMDDLFSDFINVPLATASIAQVHRATLLNGQEVVVKVQHQGIKTVILEDLKNAKSIVDWIAWAEPQYNFNPMIDEWCKEAPKELDFIHEAENTRTVSKNLGCKTKCDNHMNANRVDVLIPEVIQSTEKILILEYMDGIRLNDSESLEAFGVNKQKIVEEITRAYAHQIYIDGFFNGDPHPGNFLVSKEPPHRPVLLDFGLTKKLSNSFKQALAKMFLASAEGDHVALLSAFAEMGLKLRLDVPEQAMEETMKSLAEQRNKNVKVIQEKMKLNKKEAKRFNPVDAFPGDVVIFSRVLNLLRGLSSMMNVHIVYLDIMRPFATYALQRYINKGPKFNNQWIYDTPVHSDVETKLRQLLLELGSNDKILGIQVCAYKDGKVIIDTAAGLLGKYDPRPVQPDSIFPVFSVTKGITAGMLHWLVDNGKLNLEENVANIWPEFCSNGKDLIKVHHVLNHTSGLRNAMTDVILENPLLLSDWNECLNRIAMALPQTEPGQEQSYHYLSFGWLCGGVIEHASGRKFQEILEEAFIQPLQIEGELYIGIPPGKCVDCVESRLASLTLDTDDLESYASSGVDSRLAAALAVDIDDLKKLFEISNHTGLPSNFQLGNVAQLLTTVPALFNMLQIRRAIIPAANGHCSGRALARYYAALVDGGVVPPPHSSSSKPPLGSYPHIPQFPNLKSSRKQKANRTKEPAAASKTKHNRHVQNLNYRKDLENGNRFRYPHALLVGDTSSSYINETNTTDSSTTTNPRVTRVTSKVFNNPGIHDAFWGVGEYENFAKPGGTFGLGFERYYSKDGSLIAYGHSGMGGSTGYCDVKNRFAIAVTLNKMSFGAVTARIVQFVCSELNIPTPENFPRLMGDGT